MPVRQNVRRQNVRSAKCLSAKCLLAKCLSAKCPATDLFKEENGKVGEKKNVRSSRNPVQWTSEHQRALESLIDQITSPPILAYPEYDAPFIVHTDASQEGLGAVIYQEQQGTIRVIAYASS